MSAKTHIALNSITIFAFKLHEEKYIRKNFLTPQKLCDCGHFYFIVLGFFLSLKSCASL